MILSHFVGINSFHNSDYLLEGLTVLKNRGYDSAGIATLSPDSQMVRSLQFYIS